MPVANTAGSPGPVAASRPRGPGWRDPRLWIGVVLVAASVVGGARLLAAADDTVAVWAASGRHGAGDRLERDDLTTVQVRFADDATQADYYTATDTLPAELVLSRGVEPGELLPRASIGAADDVDVVEVPIAVDPELVPGSVSTGAVVDVYLVAAAGTAAQGTGAAAGAATAPALSGVTVLEAPALGDGFGTTGKRQLVLAVPSADASGFFALLGASQSPVLTVVRRG